MYLRFDASKVVGGYAYRIRGDFSKWNITFYYYKYMKMTKCLMIDAVDLS